MVNFKILQKQKPRSNSRNWGLNIRNLVSTLVGYGGVLIVFLCEAAKL